MAAPVDNCVPMKHSTFDIIVCGGTNALHWVHMVYIRYTCVCNGYTWITLINHGVHKEQCGYNVDIHVHPAYLIYIHNNVYDYPRRFHILRHSFNI